jgi:IS30 family transposase
VVFEHWEADTIIGKAHKGVIVTLDERISKQKRPRNKRYFSKSWLIFLWLLLVLLL